MKNNLFSVIDKKTGQKLRRGSYETADRKCLRKQMSDIKIVCCCNDQVEMKISSNLHFYPAKKTDNHEETCTRHKNYKSNSEYDKAWKKNDDGNYSVRLEALIPCNDTSLPPQSGQAGRPFAVTITNKSPL